MRKLFIAFIAILLIIIAACTGGELMTNELTPRQKLDSIYKTMEPIQRIKAITLDNWKNGVFSDTSSFEVVSLTVDTVYHITTDLSEKTHDSIKALIFKYNKELNYIRHYDSVIVNNIYNYKINIGAVKRDDNPEHKYVDDNNRKYTLVPDARYTDDSIRHMMLKIIPTQEYSNKLDNLNDILTKHNVKSYLVGYSVHLSIKRKNTDSVIYTHTSLFNEDFIFNKKLPVQP
jgi:hypothetical protein